MDRSFLSDEQVVAASRQFVCIRLATYEDQKEANFMESVYVSRSGQLENTVFAILSPDGKRKLARSGRGPFQAYRNGGQMATGMNRIAAQYPETNRSRADETRLPQMNSLDLALNVAACDGLPLIVTVGKDKQQLDELHSRLLPLVWSESIAGQFIYASVLDKQELKPVAGVKDEHDILVIEPGQFGLSGKVLARIDSDAARDEIKSKLHDAIARYPRKQNDHSTHVRLGIQLGVNWESEIPETDQRSIRAKERARGNR